MTGAPVHPEKPTGPSKNRLQRKPKNTALPARADKRW